MFGRQTNKNRRLNAKEFAEELEESRIWGHKPRTYIRDRPFYTDIIPEPLVNQPLVNFQLNFTF